ncbi:MAG: PEGA domain-containing protein, partial [Pseudohongiellaceae bacterium]
MSDHKQHENKSGVEPIVPIDFTPADKTRRSVSFRLSPARVLIGGAAVLFAAAAWFVLTAKSVFIDISPVNGEISIDKFLAIKIGPRYLMPEGEAQASISAEGYYQLDTSLTVTEEQTQTFSIDLIPLPGFLNLTTTPVNDASVYIDGEAIGTTPLSRIELAAGEHTLAIQRERFEPVETTVAIEGRSIEQNLELELLPFWADVSFNTQPAGASVFINGEERGLTPLTTQILQGEHEVLVKLAAHKAWTEELEIMARQDLDLPLIELEAADGLVLLQSTPSNAGVLLNGNYQGQTPLEIPVTPEQNHELTFFSNGYQQTTRNVRLEPESETALNVTLDP